jgi:hypothetical protein
LLCLISCCASILLIFAHKIVFNNFTALPASEADRVCADCKRVHLTMRAWSHCNCNWSDEPKSAVITPPKKKNSQNYHGGDQDDNGIDYKVYTSDREKSINVDEEEEKGTLNNRTKRIMRKDAACSKKRKKVAYQNKWGLAKKKTNRVKTIESTDDDDDDNYEPTPTDEDTDDKVQTPNTTDDDEMEKKKFYTKRAKRTLRKDDASPKRSKPVTQHNRVGLTGFKLLSR